MLKRYTCFLFLIVGLFAACSHQQQTSGKNGSTGNAEKKAQSRHRAAVIPINDSSQLVNYLNQLPSVHLPFDFFEVEDSPDIDLKPFEHQKLFNLKYKRIPRIIGDFEIDGNKNESTFSLCDSAFRGSWVLVAKKPAFFVIAVNGTHIMLVTMDYYFNLIDAIHAEASSPSEKGNLGGDLYSTVYPTLKIVLHYSYDIPTGQKGYYTTKTEDDVWHIDSTGHFMPVKLYPAKSK